MAFEPRLVEIPAGTIELLLASPGHRRLKAGRLTLTGSGLVSGDRFLWAGPLSGPNRYVRAGLPLSAGHHSA